MSMTSDQTHCGCQPSNQLSPSSKPNQFLLLNQMMNELRCPQTDHPTCQDAPRDSSVTKPPAIFCAIHCIISLILKSQMPLPSLFPTPLHTIATQAPSLKLKNTAMVWCTLSPKKPSHTTEVYQGSPTQGPMDQGNEQRHPSLGERMYCTNATFATSPKTEQLPTLEL
jgi:hypothetical protein